MNKSEFIPPSFSKRAAATFIDFLLLFGAYLVLGFISEHLYKVDAYPPPTGMQFYSERDFSVFWFFVRSIFILTITYLWVSYQFFGATLGQKLARIKLLNEAGSKLTTKNIFLRIISVILRLFLISVPGPIVAILFLAIGESFLNETLSMLLLMMAVLALLYFSITKYQQGDKRSISDRISNTIMIDLDKSA